jgi:tetratricopeptide (TPR) repeat protein
LRAPLFALAAISLVTLPAAAEPGLAHVGGATYGEARITASTARYWNNCAAGVEVGATLAVRDCGRIIGARLSRTRTASALYYRGRAYRDVGRSTEARADFQDAFTTFEQILHDDTDDPIALYGRGLSLIGLGRTAEGAADIDHATNLNANVAADFSHRITF